MQEDDGNKKGLIAIEGQRNKAIAEASDEVRKRSSCHSLCRTVLRKLLTFMALPRPVTRYEDDQAVTAYAI